MSTKQLKNERMKTVNSLPVPGIRPSAFAAS